MISIYSLLADNLSTDLRENLIFKHFEAKPTTLRYHEVSTWSFKPLTDHKQTPKVTLDLPGPLSSLCSEIPNLTQNITVHHRESPQSITKDTKNVQIISKLCKLYFQNRDQAQETNLVNRVCFYTKLYWNTATCLCSHIVQGCFQSWRAEPNSCTWELTACEV